MSSEEFTNQGFFVEKYSYYTKCLKVYHNNSREFSTMLNWIDTEFHDKVVGKLPVLDQGTRLKIMGVGCGTGEYDMKLIFQLLRKFPQISSTLVDPSSYHLSEFKEWTATNGFVGVDWQWCQQTWQQFSQGSDGKICGNEKYHFISAMHVLYYVAEWQKTVLEMIDYLEEGGILMILVNSDDSAFNAMSKRFPSLNKSVAAMYTSDMEALLERNNLEFEAIPVTHDAYVDITCMYKDGDQDGRMMIDFLAHVKDFSESAPPAIVDEFMAYCRGPDCSVQNGENILLKCGSRVYVITKAKTA